MPLTNKEIQEAEAVLQKMIDDDPSGSTTREIKQRLAKFRKDNPQTTPSIKCAEVLEELITVNPAMLTLKENVKLLCPHPDTVLIIGESGTGKEIIANALHGDRSGAFIDINCAGLPEYLIESELFGHVRGSFTGADRDKVGLIESAQNGTLFLDEVGELPLQVQAKLLRVLQTRRIRKVGSNENSATINVRFVCATHQNIPELVGEKKFRLDLYARLSTFMLGTIPIRDRREDIEPIVNSLDRSGKAFKALMDVWPRITFPLNVRDIQNLVRQWQVLGKIL